MDFDAYEPSPEMIKRILLPLDPQDLRNTCLADSRFHSICESESFWQEKVEYDLREFPRLLNKIRNKYPGVTWKNRYIASMFRPKVYLTNNFSGEDRRGQRLNLGSIISSLPIAQLIKENHTKVSDWIHEVNSEEITYLGLFYTDDIKVIDPNTLQFFFLLRPQLFSEEGYKSYVEEIMEDYGLELSELEIALTMEEAIIPILQEARILFDRWVDGQESTEGSLSIWINSTPKHD